MYKRSAAPMWNVGTIFIVTLGHLVGWDHSHLRIWISWQYGLHILGFNFWGSQLCTRGVPHTCKIVNYRLIGDLLLVILFPCQSGHISEFEYLDNMQVRDPWVGNSCPSTSLMGSNYVQEECTASHVPYGQCNWFLIVRETFKISNLVGLGPLTSPNLNPRICTIWVTHPWVSIPTLGVPNGYKEECCTHVHS